MIGYSSAVLYHYFMHVKTGGNMKSKNNSFRNENALLTLEEYMNNLNETNKTYKEFLKSLARLDIFLKKQAYTLTLDKALKLLQTNANLSSLLMLIADKHKTYIENDAFSEIFENDTLQVMMEAYCLLHNTEDFSLEDSLFLDDEDTYSQDGLTMYFKEIKKRPLLSFDEEQELAKRIKNHDEEAKRIFIASNLRLVVNIAKKYVSESLTLADLIQEGNMGLMMALEKYECERGLKFSTYASYWIKKYILSAIKQKSRMIRLPSHVYAKVIRYHKTVSLLEDRLKRTPSLEEIAKEMSISLNEVRELARIQADTLSINIFIGEDKNTELEEIVVSPEESFEENVICKIMQKDVQVLLESASLTDKELKVLQLRYGFIDGEEHTFKEIGDFLHLSHERVRQIEAKALKKLRTAKNIKKYSGYMANEKQSLEHLEVYKKNYLMAGGSAKTFLKTRKSSLKYQTIYEFLGYPKEEIDTLLETLSDKEKQIIFCKYGQDLNHPVFKKMTEKEKNQFYNLMSSLRKRLLAQKQQASLENISLTLSKKES